MQMDCMCNSQGYLFSKQLKQQLGSFSRQSDTDDGAGLQLWSCLSVKLNISKVVLCCKHLGGVFLLLQHHLRL